MAFSADGKTVLAMAGRPGLGEDRFIHPAAVTVLGTDILVLDNGQQRIHEYGSPEQGLPLKKSIPLPFPVDRLCGIRGRLFGVGYHAGAMVHEFDLGGHVVRSFGRLFDPDTVVAASMSGYVTCVTEPRPGVAVTSINVPQVWLYELDGTLRWSADLPSFTPGGVTRVPGSSAVRFGTAEGKADVTVSLVQVEDRLIVQWGRGFDGMASLEDIKDVTTAVFRLSDGVRLSTSGSTRRVDAAAGSRGFSRNNDPFPGVRAFSFDKR